MQSETTKQKFLALLKETVFTKEMIMYAIIGVGTVIADFGTSAVFKYLFAHSQYCAAISQTAAWIAAAIFSFLGNKVLVFKSKSWLPKVVLRELSQSLGVRLISGLANIFFMWIFVDKSITGAFADNYTARFWLFKIVIGVFVVIFDYVCNKFIIFSKKKIIKNNEK